MVSHDTSLMRLPTNSLVEEVETAFRITAVKDPRQPDYVSTPGLSFLQGRNATAAAAAGGLQRSPSAAKIIGEHFRAQVFHVVLSIRGLFPHQGSSQKLGS